MKKNFKFYLLAWILLLAIFNIVAFVTPSWQTLEKYTPSFWIGYSFITVSFIGQLVCAVYVFKEKDARKQFYKISLFTASYIGLAISFVVGIVFMIVPILPYWIGAIVCPLILSLNVIAVLKAKVAADIVSEIDDKIEKKRMFIDEMKHLSEDLLFRADTDQVKRACKEVNDAFRYSDPISVKELSDIENEILESFESLKQAVRENDTEAVLNKKNELLALIAERNSLCKKLK